MVMGGEARRQGVVERGSGGSKTGKGGLTFTCSG